MRPAWIWSRKSVSGATDIWNKTVWSLAPVRFGTPLKSLDERRFESALLRKNNPLGMEPVGYHTVIRRRRALFDFVDKDTAISKRNEGRKRPSLYHSRRMCGHAGTSEIRRPMHTLNSRQIAEHTFST